MRQIILHRIGASMHLKAATEEYILSGLPRPGFPILLWEDLTSCWEGNEFFRHYLQRGAIGSSNSWEPIARAIYDYFGYLEAQGLDWRDVNRGEEKNLVAGYRDYCFEVAKLKRNTVRHRLVYVCEFYVYARSQGWVARLPYSMEIRHLCQQGGFLSHVEASNERVEVRSVMPRKHQDLVKFLTKSQGEDLIGAAKNVHHEAIIRLALGTGLRREELATFPLAYVFDPDKAGVPTRNVRCTLDPSDGSGMQTKGSKARVIYMTRSLMKHLHRYAIHHRRARASQETKEYPNLFLNERGQPWAKNGKGIEAMVRKLGKAIGIAVHPHMLRHTYATQMLIALQRNRKNNRIEPLVFIQGQLGHASIHQTTQYLHLVNELADDAVLAYDDELNDFEGML